MIYHVALGDHNTRKRQRNSIAASGPDIELADVDVNSEDTWSGYFDLLLLYSEINGGDCNAPESYSIPLGDGNEVKLGEWLIEQRTEYRENSLTADRLARLQELVDERRLSWFGNGPDITVGEAQGTV